jgi:uncharacterized membrane protein
MSKPKIMIQPTLTDRVLETLGVLGIILTVAYIMANYNELPDILPRHYDASGQPNGFSGKSILIIFPFVVIVIYVILTIALRSPHLLNHPFEITQDNAGRQYKNIILLIRILKIFLVAVFFYLTYATIQNGLGKMHGLGTWFVPVTLLSAFGTVLSFLYKGYRLR